MRNAREVPQERAPHPAPGQVFTWAVNFRVHSRVLSKKCRCQLKRLVLSKARMSLPIPWHTWETRTCTWLSKLPALSGARAVWGGKDQ